MNNEENMITLTDWEIITDFRTRGDPLRLRGRIFNHPNIIDGTYGFPSNFIEFDPITKTGKGLSGRIYKLENFVANGNAKDESVALEFLKSNVEFTKKLSSWNINNMNEIFIIEKGPGNFTVKLNNLRILGSAKINNIWDKEEDAMRACLLANQAYALAKKVWNQD